MREQDEKVRGVMEEHRPEEERREGQAVEESHDEEQDHEEVTEGDLETFGGGGGEEEELGVLCFICGSIASHPQLAACLCSTCRSCAAETGGREGRVTCSKCDVSTPISALLPDYVHDRSAPSPPPSAHPSPPRLASLQSLLHRFCLRNMILSLFVFPLRARTRGGGVESYGDPNPECQQVPLSTDAELLALLSQGEEESRSKIEESYVFLRRALDQARDSALQQLEERVKLRRAAKKKSLHQQEGVEAALQYGERLVASCGQDQVDLLQPLVQERLLNMLNLEQGCGEDHLEVESSLLWQVGDKDAAERAVQVSTVKLLDSNIQDCFKLVLRLQAAFGGFSSPLPSPSRSSSSPGCDMLGSLLRASPQPLPLGQITPSPSQMGHITPSPGLLR